MKYHLYCLFFSNGKRYFGITKYSVAKRIRQHLMEADRGSNYLVHKAIRKYKFTYKTLKSELNKKEAVALEIYYIAKYKTKYLKGYNQTSGGDGVRNLKYTAKIRKNISKAQKQRFADPQQRIKTALAGKGKPFYVYKKDGTFVGKFYNQTQFAADYKINQGHISQSLNNYKKRKSVKGMIFAYTKSMAQFLLNYNKKFQWNENSRYKNV